MDMVDWFVLKKISDSCNEDFEKAMEARLDYVKDLDMDEDGDYATDFIFAESNPFKDDTGQSLGEVISNRSDVDSNNMFTDTADTSNSYSDMLTCNYCRFEMLIESFVKLNCGCVLCKFCIDTRVNSCVNMKIPMANAFRCPEFQCEDFLNTSVANFPVPGAFDSFLRCPNSHNMIKKWSSSAPSFGITELNRVVAPFVMQDSNIIVSHADYIYCADCGFEKCRACGASPYHQEMSCTELEGQNHTPKCRYCDSSISSTNSGTKVEARSKSIRDLRNDMKKAGLDTSWCIEKGEFLSVLQFELSVCMKSECRAKMMESCTKKLACGHRCGGISKEQLCLHCLEKKCQGSVMLKNQGCLSSGDYICPICHLPLRMAPSIRLECGHIVHFQCSNKMFQDGSHGPEITFGMPDVLCPVCPALMRHYSLVSILQSRSELSDLVKEKAVNRQQRDRLDKNFDPQWLDYNPMSLYRYFVCKICNTPYYAGTRDSENNQRNEQPAELICSACTAACNGICKIEEHNERFIKYKCRYCCLVASHNYNTSRPVVCQRCYNYEQENGDFPSAKECDGPEWCPLQMAHGPYEQDCCLGCMACRKLGQ